ncbi:hypothetical protein LZ554_003555 [Drepanopeziza brunnea f. sp. 'monogermtubi']|nr:hypothetical protein LZ554_003555 [Drepanopeziza brunnea f. sp. 'monogermtubi']
MQFPTPLPCLALFAALCSAVTLPEKQVDPNRGITAGECGFDEYNNQNFCIVNGISYGCTTGTCAEGVGKNYPCSGSWGNYVCPKATK